MAIVRALIAIVLISCLPNRASAQTANATSSKQPTASSSTNLGTVIGQSIRLLLIEHGTRIAFQEKTRRELAGPFWKDYQKSIRWPHQWEDTDSWGVNYIGHPIHGAAAALIWLDYGGHRDLTLSLDKKYWASRARAAGYAAAYSVQFEIGPLSEASIGNVGMRPETTGWVDHVVTPGGAFGLLVAGDALDRYFVQWVEKYVGNRVVRATLRVIFNPSRTLANTAEMRLPWERANRPLSR